jgi:hypothetical protein
VQAQAHQDVRRIAKTLCVDPRFSPDNRFSSPGRHATSTEGYLGCMSGESRPHLLPPAPERGAKPGQARAQPEKSQSTAVVWVKMLHKL